MSQRNKPGQTTATQTRQIMLRERKSSGAIVRETIRVRGLVQGVGFRPQVWRLACDLGVRGEVRNDGEGVLIHAWAPPNILDSFVEALQSTPPPLAKIDKVERLPGPSSEAPADFSIAASDKSRAHTGIVPDAASCRECLHDTLDPVSRRFRYPFTNCTHCGPRFSILRDIPYDRSNTSMAVFELCEKCRQEYQAPENRRFHAQPNACHRCGPKVWLARSDGGPLGTEALTQVDDVDAACTLLQRGEILAIKGIGGFHLASDATNESVVARLRARKRRIHKPFALMARSPDIICEYCAVSDQEAALLQSAEAPILILFARGPKSLAPSVAPGQRTLGFMLPYTPLHHLLLRRLDRPIVLTSGNLSEEPQCIDNDDAAIRLSRIADYLLLHDREIINRVDDSVLRIMAGEARILRRARGFAPAPLPLPKGFEQAPDLLAMGGELKNTFCLVKDGQAILSQHMGDLEDAETYADYRNNLDLYARLYQHQPTGILVDKHPDYLSSKLGEEWAHARGLPLDEVQHHHAHMASCMAENGLPLDHEPVLGVVLDGLGFGEDGTLWGGEFLLADYLKFQRLGTFKPVAMLGGAQAIREPWRNTYAHLMAEMGWPNYKLNYDQLALTRYFETKPLATLEAMLKQAINAPLASSCGRLFDAVAAAVGVCRESASYEGQAAIELEASVDAHTLQEEDESLAYPFAIRQGTHTGLLYIEPLAMWRAVLDDLLQETPPGVMAARFHKGLARSIVAIVVQLCTRDDKPLTNVIALSGGVFQNKILFEQVKDQLESQGFNVLTHRLVPANDGGLALGQAAVGVARSLCEGY